MNTQATLQLMQRIKLNGMANCYEAILDLPVNKQPGVHECIATLVDAEIQNRSHKRTQMLLIKNQQVKIYCIASGHHLQQG